MSDYISERNLVLILKYLPVKTLLQFRSVCKGWKQLIDSPALVQQHLSAQSPKFILQNGRRRRFFVVDLLHRPRHTVKPLNKPVPREGFYLVGTLHGIVCLYNLTKFFLWNPSIRKILRIDRPKQLIWSDETFVYDQLQATFGFWINPSTKEFKIIYLQRRPTMICYLYLSVRGDWSVIPTPTKVENWSSCKEGPPVMIGDVAHWGGCLDEVIGVYHMDHDHEDKAILSFCFVQECFETIELCNPREFSKNECGSPGDYDCFMDYYDTAPFRWKDTLAFLSWSKEPPFRCKIFMRKENSWVGMFDFQPWDNFDHVFWAMEGLEEVKKRGKGKRKREIEENDLDFVGAQDNVRVLATTPTDRKNSIGALVINGTGSFYKKVKDGLDPYFNVIMAYDFVESLLFP